MKMQLLRKPSGLTCTIGELHINGEFFCHTLEDIVRPAGEAKVPGETAIPAGQYQVELTVSGAAVRGRLWTPNHDFKLPQILNVPGFEGVRIHAGNTDRDTEGCVLVGEWSGGEFISKARSTLVYLMDLLDIEAIVNRPVSIEICDAA